MFQNDVFERNWQKVEETFQNFLKANVLPLTIVAGKDKITVTKDSLRKQLDSIHDEIFTVSVCGQVKAGKSTLLNSLFFGDDVLPVFDTPMTAKLTFLEYQDGNPGFTVEFYSTDEWKELRSIMEEENKEALQQLDERCQYCGEEYGEYCKTWIGHSPVSCSKLTELAQYVSVPKNTNSKSDGCGRYTPFVKLVRIHLPQENLKNIRIVDTPGLNDSNIINSLQTTEWVKNAHAVVYVLDVTGAHEPDIRFFQKYFPSSAADARIFVQNKIDSNPDASSVKETIRRYGQEKIYKDLGLFGEKETICSYSGLLALRQSKINAGKTPSKAEDWAYNLDWIDEDFNPDPDHLQEQLSRKLYQRSGCIRISRVLGEFINLAMEKQRQLKATKEQKVAQAGSCDLDLEKLNKKISELKKFLNEIDMKINSVLKDEDGTLFKEISELKVACQKCNDEIRKKINREINGLEHTDDIKYRLPSIFMSSIRQHYSGPLSRKVIKTKERLYQFLEKQKDDLLQLASQYGIFEDLVSAKYIETDFGSQIDKKVEELNRFDYDLINCLPNAFINIFTMMTTIRSKAFKCASDALDVLYEKFSDICEELKTASQKQSRSYCSSVAEWGNERKTNLETVENNFSDKETIKAQCLEEAQKLDEQANSLDRYINDLKIISEVTSLGEK